MSPQLETTRKGQFIAAVKPAPKAGTFTALALQAHGIDRNSGIALDLAQHLDVEVV